MLQFSNRNLAQKRKHFWLYKTAYFQILNGNNMNTLYRITCIYIMLFLSSSLFSFWKWKGPKASRLCWYHCDTAGPGRSDSGECGWEGAWLSLARWTAVWAFHLKCPVVCLSVTLLSYRITCLWFCNKKGMLFVPDPVFHQSKIFWSSIYRYVCRLLNKNC